MFGWITNLLKIKSLIEFVGKFNSMDKIKAYGVLLAIVVVGIMLLFGGLGVFCIGAAFWLIIQTLRGKVAPYAFNLWLSLDQTINTVLGGNPDHTLSGRVGYHAQNGNKICIEMEKVINKLFGFQKEHCRSSIEKDEVPETEPGFGRS